jgi:glutathione S-transferase
MNRTATFDLTLKRFIRAPREKVFDAFVKAEHARNWMCPRGMTIPVAEFDARVGGTYRITMRARDGEQFTAGGSYREIARPERLTYTWAWQGEGMPNLETLITVGFSERDGGTELTMTHSGFPDAALRDSHEEGWGSSLNNLCDRLDERGQAASVTLIGDPRSSYTRTARMGLAEKGVKYTLQPAAPHSPEVLALHPFGRIPAFRDGPIELFETSAILRYVEEAFPGPSLLPGNIRDRARCEQWVSAINAYVDGPLIRRYVLNYVFPKGADGKPDRGAIDAAVKEMPAILATLDKAYGGRDYLAGKALSMADLFLAPIMFYVEMFPEGKALAPKYPNLARGQAAIRERASFKETMPPLGS